MKMRCYLAMTGAEFTAAAKLPEHTAWMACHFSCYGTGLSNLPASLPKDSMIILNDRTPVQGHDSGLILEQLTILYEQLMPSCFLLDLQRPGASEITKVLTRELPCPVGVTAAYAQELSCPVFLEPPPLHIPLREHLESWKGREIWLEAALEAEKITVDTQGSRVEPADISILDEPAFEEPELHCRYNIRLAENTAVFQLLRAREDLATLLEDAQKCGVTQAVGLYQQLAHIPEDSEKS